MASIYSLQVGRTVRCPEDRGIPAHWGEVAGFSKTIYENVTGVPYIWVKLRRMLAEQTPFKW